MRQNDPLYSVYLNILHEELQPAFGCTEPAALAYAAALAEDERDFGPPPPGYPLGDSAAFEQIGAVEARPDRLALYRGRQLHSGIIPDPAALSDDPATGRLTVNMFLFGS